MERVMVRYSLRSRFEDTPNAISRALEGARRAGRALLHLAESNPTEVGLSLGPSELQSLLANPHAARYAPEAFGLLAARCALSDDFARRGFSVAAERIMLTASTSEAYGFLFKLLCDPGDNVLVPAPSYPLFDTLAQLEGVRLVPYRLAYDGEWHLDAASPEQARDGRTRAIITVHPNNPTGSFLKRGELARLAAAGLPIISDEVFAEYGLVDDPQRAESALEAAGRTLVFRLGGLSKSLALPQLKLAWTAIAGPKDAAQEASARLEHIADAYLSPSAPVQLALPALLERSAAVQARIRERARDNLETLRRTFTNSAVSVLRVEGGWYAMLRLPEVLDEEAWTLALLEQDGVIVQPGYFYDVASGAHAVVSLISEPRDLALGAERILRRVEEVIGGALT